ncbi:hypothetical protein J6590_018415 [Homalodisca vitripennis]|nr:hypothetical protein J6590_018415 [Homalodisca vitripennis]
MSVAAIADKTKHGKRAIYRFRKMSLMIQADMCAALVVPTTQNIYVCQLQPLLTRRSTVSKKRYIGPEYEHDDTSLHVRSSCCTYNTEHICMSVAAIADKTKHGKRAIYRFRKMSLMIQADMCAALVVPTTRNIYVCQLQPLLTRRSTLQPLLTRRSTVSKRYIGPGR